MDNRLQHKWNVFGHAKLIRRLERDLDEKRLGHALLVVGPAKIGKYTVLKRLAMELQCNENCDLNCKICHAIEEKRHLDTFIFDSEDESIKIEEMRNLSQNLNLSSQSNYKIVIIKNIERMSIPAANSLLKILEEPPKGVMFLLTSSDTSNVLDTIISRCRVYVASSDNEGMVEFLKKEFAETGEEKIAKACSYADGYIGKAIKLLREDELYDQFVDWEAKMADFFDNGSRSDLIKYSEMISELDKGQLDNYFWLLTFILRRKLIESKGGLEKKNYAGFLEDLHKTFDKISKNINTRLALDLLFLRNFANSSNVKSF